jgi:polyferredoxin
MKKTYLYATIRLVFLALFFVLVVTKRFQLWLVLYLAGVILSLFFGRIYCGYICPMNTVMRHVQRFSRSIGLQRRSTPKWMESTKLPYLTLILAVGSMIVGKQVFQKELPILLILFVLSMGVTLFVKSSVWHNGLCPYSILLRIAAKSSKRTHRVQTESCIGCRKCIAVCPAGAIAPIEGAKKVQIDQSLCHQCEACSEVCPTNAISFR